MALAAVLSLGFDETDRRIRSRYIISFEIFFISSSIFLKIIFQTIGGQLDNHSQP